MQRARRSNLVTGKLPASIEALSATLCEMRVDFGRTARDHAAHRAGFPDMLFDRLAVMGVCSAGKSVLDLGTHGVARAWVRRLGARRGPAGFEALGARRP